MYGASVVPHNGTPTPPLRPCEPLPLNYGRGGGEPLRFALGEGRKAEVGFIKVFVSNEWFDLSVMDQQRIQTIQPNGGTREIPPPGEGRGWRTPVIVWDEITLPVVQI
jgi:hypothetical protein